MLVPLLRTFLQEIHTGWFCFLSVLPLTFKMVNKSRARDQFMGYAISFSIVKSDLWVNLLRCPVPKRMSSFLKVFFSCEDSLKPVERSRPFEPSYIHLNSFSKAAFPFDHMPLYLRCLNLQNLHLFTVINLVTNSQMQPIHLVTIFL